MSQKVKKYIDFLKNPTNYIKNEKITCDAVNALIIETDALVQLMDKDTKYIIESTFPQINEIKCGQSFASLLNNTRFVNLNDMVQILITKYLYIVKLLGDEEVQEPVRNCDNIREYIDKIISENSIQQLLNGNNIFSDKPVNYKVDIATPDNSQNLVSSCLKDLKPSSIFSNKDLEIIVPSSVGGKELFNQKKKFADEITKVMSNGLLFNDKKQDIINNFQYLINKMFNDKIAEYIKLKGYKEDAIYFIYKGGTTMKIIYDKYKSILPQNNQLFDNNANYFGRSDADYGIFIDKDYFKTPDGYNQVLCDVNKISYNLLIQIQDIISNNSECLCPIDNITTSDLDSLLGNLNTILSEDKKKDRKKREIPNFRDIKEFIGITVNNKDYFSKPIPSGLKNDQLCDRQIITSKSSLADMELDTDDTPSNKAQLKMYGRIKPARENFIIKIQESNDATIPKFSPGVCVTDKKPNPKGIYYYFNEANKFRQHVSLTEFNLHRLKINTIVYYTRTDGKYGYFNCPSELIDVSISNFYDFKIRDINLTKILKKYKNKQTEFYSYSLYGFIDDLAKGLFNEAKYPWGTNKYSKKIYRVTFFLFIYINNKFNNTQVIYDTIRKFFNDLTANTVTDIDSFQLEEKSGNKYPIKNDEMIYKLYNGILARYNLVQAESIPADKIKQMDEFKKFIQIFDDTMKLFKPENVTSGYADNIEDVPFLEKYMKYKNKYFALLKKLGHKH